MKDLTDTHLGEFTDERMRHFRKRVNYEQFGDCTQKRMKGSTQERMGKLTPKHARNFYEEGLQLVFDENHMNDFTEKQIENFTEEQTVDFTGEIGDSTEENAQVRISNHIVYVLNASLYVYLSVLSLVMLDTESLIHCLL